jgi:phosphoethanolamine N-methyltransferase
VAQRGYDLREVPAYGRIFTDLGFHNVQAVDVTDQFVASLEAELAKMSEIREAFVAEFGQKDFDYLVSGWKAKMVRCGEGNQRWGLFYCEK